VDTSNVTEGRVPVFHSLSLKNDHPLCLMGGNVQVTDTQGVFVGQSSIAHTDVGSDVHIVTAQSTLLAVKMSTTLQPEEKDTPTHTVKT